MAVVERSSGILSARSRGRYREVLAVLMRYGLAEVVENLAHGRISSRVPAKAVRDALCELGPAFIKFGQMLSTREELLSKSFRDELAKLQDEATPISFCDARDVIEKELGAEVSRLFERIEETPMASGSIGQVHRAWLMDGTEVVVKVQRKGLEELLECDTAILEELIFRFGKRPGQGDSAARLVSDFLNDVQSELDYGLEASNLDRFAWQFEHDPKIRVPRVIRTHSARHVLTTTYEGGTKLADVAGYTAVGRSAAQGLAKTLLRQIFCFGFFHGDPHADNVTASADGAIGFYDFGLMGELCVSEREQMNALLLGLLQQDVDGSTAALLGLAGSAESVDCEALREDMRGFIAEHRPSSTVQVTRLLADILAITAKHRLVLPRGFYLAFKVLATADSVGRRIDPGFDLVRIALPVLRQNQSSPLPLELDGANLFGTGAGALWRFQDLSAALRATLTQLSQGQMKIQFDHVGLEDAARCYDRANLRLVSVMFVAFLTLGGYGVIGCSVVARLMALREAGIASLGLALMSGSVVFLLTRATAYGNRRRER